MTVLPNWKVTFLFATFAVIMPSIAVGEDALERRIVRGFEGCSTTLDQIRSQITSGVLVIHITHVEQNSFEGIGIKLADLESVDFIDGSLGSGSQLPGLRFNCSESSCILTKYYPSRGERWHNDLRQNDLFLPLSCRWASKLSDDISALISR